MTFTSDRSCYGKYTLRNIVQTMYDDSIAINDQFLALFLTRRHMIPGPGIEISTMRSKETSLER